VEDDDRRVQIAPALALRENSRSVAAYARTVLTAVLIGPLSFESA
jgi:hypothetical protein